MSENVQVAITFKSDNVPIDPEKEYAVPTSITAGQLNEIVSAEVGAEGCFGFLLGNKLLVTDLRELMLELGHTSEEVLCLEIISGIKDSVPEALISIPTWVSSIATLQTVAVGSSDGIIHWHGKTIHASKAPLPVALMHVTEDGGEVPIFGTIDGKVVSIGESGEVLPLFEGSNPISSLMVSQDGSRLIIGDRLGHLHASTAHRELPAPSDSLIPVWRKNSHQDRISALVPSHVSPVNFLSSGYDNRILFWDILTPTTLLETRTPKPVLGGASNGEVFGTWHDDGSLSFWDIRTDLGSSAMSSGVVHERLISGGDMEDKLVVTVSVNGELKVHDIRNIKGAVVHQKFDETLTAVKFWENKIAYGGSKGVVSTLTIR